MTSSFKDLNLKNYDFRFCVELPIKAKEQIKVYKHRLHEKRIKGIKTNEFKDGFLILLELFGLFFKVNLILLYNNNCDQIHNILNINIKLR